MFSGQPYSAPLITGPPVVRMETAQDNCQSPTASYRQKFFVRGLPVTYVYLYTTCSFSISIHFVDEIRAILSKLVNNTKTNVK